MTSFRVTEEAVSTLTPRLFDFQQFQALKALNALALSNLHPEFHWLTFTVSLHRDVHALARYESISIESALALPIHSRISLLQHPC
jgi:hypothetical protein